MPLTSPMRWLRTFALVLVLALASFGVALAATPKPKTTGSANAQNTFTAGVLAQTNSHNGSAILTAGGMSPGDSAEGTVTITNSGDLTGAFALSSAALADTPGPNGGKLSDRLRLDVSDITRPATPVGVSSSALSAMPARALGSFAPGEARTYRFVVSFPDGGIPLSNTSGDNAYIGSTARLRFDWTAISGGGTTTTTPAGVIPPALKLAVTPTKLVALRKPVLVARCSRTCTVTVAATIVAKQGRTKKVLAKLRSLRYSLRATTQRRIKLEIAAAARRKIRAALKRRVAVTVQVKLSATGMKTAPGRASKTLLLRLKD